MNVPPPEKRISKITAGILPSPKIDHLAGSHPFTRQIDVVFPSNPILESTFSKLHTSYRKGKAKLSEVVERAATFVNSVEYESNLLILSTGINEDDTWCIDPRGLLTLLVSKETYEKLGLIGKKLPFKNHKETHVISVPLRQNTESVSNHARRKLALERWDEERQQQGSGPWNVLYCSKDSSSEPEFPVLTTEAIKHVQCEKTEMHNVYIPMPSLKSRPSSSTAQSMEDLEDWNNDMSTFFEWVGMACLGAQRLNANDRVDPFVAVYEPPMSPRIGEVTHLRWRGFLSPDFIQKIMDIVTVSLRSEQSQSTAVDLDPACPFISVTSHACSESPVSCIPSTGAFPNKVNEETTPVRVPRVDGEDTWSTVFCPSSEGVRWCLVESLGRWDTRWG